MANSAKQYRVELLRDPQRVLAKLPRNTRLRIEDAIDGLAEDPRPHGYSKMKGYDDLYRIRVGEWRIIYAIEEDRLIVLVIEIGPRGSVYRQLSS